MKTQMERKGRLRDRQSRQLSRDEVYVDRHGTRWWLEKFPCMDCDVEYEVETSFSFPEEWLLHTDRGTGGAIMTLFRCAPGEQHRCYGECNEVEYTVETSFHL